MIDIRPYVTVSDGNFICMVANMFKEYMLLAIVVDYSMHASTLTLFPHLHTHISQRVVMVLMFTSLTRELR